VDGPQAGASPHKPDMEVSMAELNEVTKGDKGNPILENSQGLDCNKLTQTADNY